MPGVLSGLERHEWIKHGTCFGGEANAYFNRAAGLAEQVNASPVRALFASRIGQGVTSAEIRAPPSIRVSAKARGRGPRCIA